MVVLTGQEQVEARLWEALRHVEDPEIPVSVVGMGLIVYLSDFGPLKNPVFPLWWDILAVAVFSLAIYFWAMRTALSSDRIRATIDSAVESLLTRPFKAEE